MFKLQIIASHDSTRISNFLAAYCATDKEMQAFSAKVVQTKEKKLKEFNFKLLHGILPQKLTDKKTLTTMYTSFIRPGLEYGSIVFCNCTDT